MGTEDSHFLRRFIMTLKVSNLRDTNENKVPASSLEFSRKKAGSGVRHCSAFVKHAGGLIATTSTAAQRAHTQRNKVFGDCTGILFYIEKNLIELEV